MTTAHKVAKNTIIVIIGNVFEKILALIISIYLARYLGVENFGTYNFILTYLMFFVSFSGFGLDSIIIRDIARNSSITNNIMSNALFIRLITSLIAILFAIVSVHFLNYSEDTLFYVTIMSSILLFQGLSYLNESLFQSILMMEYTTMIILISKSIFTCLVLLIIFNHGTLLQIFLAYIFSEAIRTILGFIISKKFVSINLKIDLNMCKYLLKEALPFMGTYMFYIIYYRIDVLMLSELKGDVSVGIYSAAYKLTDPLLFLAGAFSSVLMPIMSKQYIEKKDMLKNTYLIGTRYIFTLMLPITAGVFILAKRIIILIYGFEFVDSTVALQILAATIIFNSINSIQSPLLASINKQKLTTLTVGITALLNILLNLVFIPKYSYIGACATTLISVMTLYFIQFYFVRKNLSLPLLNKDFIKPIISSMAMVLIILALPELNVFYSIILGAIVYTVTIVMIKGFTVNDLELLKRIRHHD